MRRRKLCCCCCAASARDDFFNSRTPVSSTDWNTAATNLLAANVASSRLSKETTNADNMAKSGEWLAESLIASLAAD